VKRSFEVVESISGCRSKAVLGVIAQILCSGVLVRPGRDVIEVSKEVTRSPMSRPAAKNHNYPSPTANRRLDRSVVLSASPVASSRNSFQLGSKLKRSEPENWCRPTW
jgi:hypothetical protein